MVQIYKPALKKVLFLNSNNATKTIANSKNTTFTWNIPEIIINELGEIQVASISSVNASTSSIYTFRINNVATYTNNNYSTDGGTAILFSLFLNNMNAMFRDDFGIYIPPQSFNSITIQVSDDYTNKDAGIATNIGFVLCLVISDLQIELAEIGNPMNDAVQIIKDKLKNHHRLV